MIVYLMSVGILSALRVRRKMCGKGRPILMIGDLLCENVSILHENRSLFMLLLSDNCVNSHSFFFTENALMCLQCYY